MIAMPEKVMENIKVVSDILHLQHTKERLCVDGTI